MLKHTANIIWKRIEPDFISGRYSREHTWRFDGGMTIPASPSPHVVPTPWSNPANVDPEEAFVASIASCHMLSFLHVAMRAGVVVERYEDDAVGVMRKNERGAVWVAAVTLRPRIVYGGATRPTAEEIDRLHHLAHEQCFISQSVMTVVTVAGIATAT